MSYKETKTIIKRNAIALLNKKTKKKYVVIESDDWGGIKMPSKMVYDQLVNKGIPILNEPFNKYDTLASEKDLSCLFETLLSIKDVNGNSPVITANTVVANPNFEKIKASNYKNYYYEPFVETLAKYPNHKKSFELWKDGIRLNVFKPQFHGREHLHIRRWLRLLQQGNKHFITAFDYGVFGIAGVFDYSKRNDCLAAFDYDELEEQKEQKEIIIKGLQLFEDIFGYRSSSFIAPTYVWDKNHESVLNQNGVKYIQGFAYQLIPNPGRDNYKRRLHYTGQRNKLGQIYLVRNAFFEPSLNPNTNWVEDVLSRASIAFKWNNPLIISSHRLNFIGDLHPKNREDNLLLFEKTLKTLLMKWPDVEFISSDRLGSILSKAHS